MSELLPPKGEVGINRVTESMKNKHLCERNGDDNNENEAVEINSLAAKVKIVALPICPSCSLHLAETKLD